MKKEQNIKLIVRHTSFENSVNSLIQHCERSEPRLHFGWTKSDRHRVTRQVKNRTKLGGKCQNWKNSDETFRMILKHCAYIDTYFKFNFEYLKTVRNGKPDFIPWL